jgi:DNA-binding response OmpR family regulator
MPTVMLIEDDVTMLSLLKTLLEIEGYQVLQYQQNTDLVATLRRDLPDTIILDVHLQRQNGLDMLKVIRGDEFLKDTRVIMSSGKNLRLECLEAGADDFLLKPFMPEDLLKSIKSTERQSKQWSGDS